MLSVEAIAISTQQVSRQLSTTCTFVFIRKRSIPMNQPPPVALSPLRCLRHQKGCISIAHQGSLYVFIQTGGLL